MKRLTLGWYLLSKIGIRRSTCKAVSYHFRLALGFLLAAVTVAVMPEGAERAAIVNALNPFEWEAEGQGEFQVVSAPCSCGECDSCKTALLESMGRE